MMKKQRRFWSTPLHAALGVLALLAGASAPAPSAPTASSSRVSLTFIRHAAFFSQEARRATVIDPQIFVREDSAPEGTGPQNIEHAAGLRPARLDDLPEVVAYNAEGTSLGFDLDKWFAATGTVDIAPQGAGDRVSATFKNLIAFGVYSLFRITFAPDGATFVPLDGDGKNDGFTAGFDGSAGVVVTTPEHLQSGNAIVLIYHSDATEHGEARGLLGVTAHHQLIVRLP